MENFKGVLLNEYCSSGKIHQDNVSFIKTTKIDQELNKKTDTSRSAHLKAKISCYQSKIKSARFEDPYDQINTTNNTRRNDSGLQPLVSSPPTQKYQQASASLNYMLIN